MRRPEMEPEQAGQFTAPFRTPEYREHTTRFIGSMFPNPGTEALRERVLSEMLATPQYVMLGAMEGMFGMQPIKPGETFKVPAMAIMVATPARANYESQLREIFPNLRKYEAWEGAGHFLMMESPERFNKSMEDFLKGL